MKYHICRAYTKKLLPAALLAAFGLSGCGGEQLGGTNTGMSGGPVAAETLLVLGGIVGIGAILNSDSSESGVVVQPAGDEAVGGSNNSGVADNDGGSSDNANNADGNTSGDNDNAGSANDNSSNENSDGADNSDGSAGSGNDSEGSDATQVPFLQPPDWLLGMWSGTGSDGVVQTGFATSSEMGVSRAGSPMSGYSDIRGVCFHILEDSDNAFVYTIWYPLPDGTEVLFNERWVNNRDGSVFYRASGAKNDEFIMHQIPATNFLQPPLWLQGNWVGESANGGHNSADINDGNIVISESINNRWNHYNLARLPDSVFQVLESNQSVYAYKLTAVETEGTVTVVSGAFQSTGTNTISYTSHSDDNQNTIHMERQ